RLRAHLALVRAWRAPRAIAGVGPGWWWLPARGVVRRPLPWRRACAARPAPHRRYRGEAYREGGHAAPGPDALVPVAAPRPLVGSIGEVRFRAPLLARLADADAPCRRSRHRRVEGAAAGAGRGPRAPLPAVPPATE